MNFIQYKKVDIMNPFENSKFLKNIKRSFIIRNIINEDEKNFKISECVFKEKDDVIYISIKIHGDNNIYKYHYIPKQLQLVNINKRHTKRKDKNCINDLEEKFDMMIIDE